MNDINWMQWGLLMFISPILIFVLALVIMWVWNIVMPVMGLPEITYWQAFGLKVLTDLMFRSGISFNDVGKKS